MKPNDLLLSLLAAGADDEAIVRAMASAVFGIAGEVGPQGFGATTLEGHLALFTQPEFYAVAGLPPELEAVEATARQAAEYAKAVGLFGFVLNPGTHQRFVGEEAIERLHSPLRPPEPPLMPALEPLGGPAPELLQTVLVVAEGSAVERVWLAEGPTIVTQPHPDAAFEAGLLARDVRVRSFGGEPMWSPVFEREAPDRAQVRLASLARPLPSAVVDDLVEHARLHRLDELWALGATFGDAEPVLAFAYSPHPHARFAADFGTLHARHALGDESPLLDAVALRDALPRIGTRLV